MPRCANCFREYRNQNPRPSQYNAVNHVTNTIKARNDGRDAARAQTPAGIQSVLTELVRQRETAFLNALGARKEDIASSNDRYRIAVLISNPINGRKTLGLIDTGANSSCVSREGLQQLGITSNLKIVNSNTQAYGVSGEALRVLGKAKLTIMVGKISYTNVFEVLDAIHGYHFVLGTDFLQNTDIFSKIYNDIANEIGHESTSTNF